MYTEPGVGLFIIALQEDSAPQLLRMYHRSKDHEHQVRNQDTTPFPILRFLLRPPPPAVSQAGASLTERKATDQDRRKQVAERLLEKASQRATEAKTGLKAAAASARREAYLAADVTGAELKTLQESVASR